MEVNGHIHAPVTLSQDKSPGTHCIGGWVGARGGLEAVMGKFPSLSLPGIEPRSSSPQHNAYTD